ncbi:MAG TPA: GNAT family N-acetyltransferase [Pedococcus sp.]|jgi:hypothetical protein|nr:GNAT family N-acetyltransferase [Pedococcus sp.]
MAQTTIADNPARHRYEVSVDGVVAGVAVYHRDGDTVTFVHTEVDAAFEGQGIGGALARGALDDVRAQGGRVVAECPFIKAWIARHPDYQDLLAS